MEWSEIIHSVPTTAGVGADLPCEEELAIIHHNYSSITQYLDRLNNYTTAQAELLVKESYDFSPSDLITKPANEFLSRYFQGQGYKDGVHGLALSGLQAFSEFVVYLKVWEKIKFEERHLTLRRTVEVMKQVESDLHFWQADSLFNEHGGIIHRIKRKFKLR